MRKLTRYFAMMAAACALLLVGPGESAGQDAAKGKAVAKAIKLGPVTGDAKHGRELFHAHTCYGCHGFNGETGARDLVGTNSPILSSEDTFIYFLRQRADQAPLTPSTAMPNFPENALSNQDAKDIYAFIRSFRLDAPKVEDVPALRAILDAAKKQ
jgi:mono/diheme cytochrome c family protein